MGFTPVFGDGSDLEVEGRCFDAARRDRNANLSLKLMSVACGPVVVALDVMEGARDEANNLVPLMKHAHPAVETLRGSRQVMCLLDSAFAEKKVVEDVRSHGWHYIIGANQWRGVLERLAQDLHAAEWSEQGRDDSRAWSQSQVAVFRHLPEGWAEPQTVIARRWHDLGELPGAPWHYAFLFTDLKADDLPRARVRKHAYAALVWMLYSTKQGRENHFKPLLSDLGLHRPPSGRLGATQAFAFVAAMAANIHAVLSLRVVAKCERGIRPWRFVRDYVTLAAQVVMAAGRRLIVRLAGAGLDEDFKLAWQHAFQVARRL
jgi:hypothetical protein